jgi:alkylated DNA repair dioxygenase AlkB
MQLALFEVPTTLPVQLHENFLSSAEADALLIHCEKLAWQQNEIRMHRLQIPVPRLECMYGSEKASYMYSGSVELKSRPWTRELLHLRDRITDLCGYQFDTVIGNLYRDGNDSIGWHADNHFSMGNRPAIASISLGATRKFSIKSSEKGATPTHYWLEHGSLLLMLPGCQSGYVHQLPKDPKCATQRINLTFRPYGS